MGKIVSIIITFIFIFSGIGYSLGDAAYIKTNLRKPMAFEKSYIDRVKSLWRKCVDKTRLKNPLPVTAEDKVPSVNSPWQIARESKGRLTPLFIAESHVSTYYVVEKAIKEGFLDPEKTIVINFDQHTDNMTIYSGGKQREVGFNNWVSHLLENKMIADYQQIGNPSDLAKLDMAALRDKHIVISIDIDYFDWFKENGDIEDGIAGIMDFMTRHNLDIRVVSMAYSFDWCRILKQDEAREMAGMLCKKMNASLSKDPGMAHVLYTSQLGVAGLSRDLSIGNKLEVEVPAKRILQRDL